MSDPAEPSPPDDPPSPGVTAEGITFGPVPFGVADLTAQRDGPAVQTDRPRNRRDVESVVVTVLAALLAVCVVALVVVAIVLSARCA